MFVCSLTCLGSINCIRGDKLGLNGGFSEVDTEASRILTSMGWDSHHGTISKFLDIVVCPFVSRSVYVY